MVAHPKNGKSLKIFDYSSPPLGGGGPLLGEAQKRTKSLKKLLAREENGDRRNKFLKREGVMVSCTLLSTSNGRRNQEI